MGVSSTFFGLIGFGIGSLVGLLVGFYLFMYSKPEEVKDPVIKPLRELDSSTLQGLLPEIPMWVKFSDYERVDWLNKYLFDMWPYLDKAISCTIRNMAKPIFAEYIGKYHIEAIEFDKLCLGSLPPIIYAIGNGGRFSALPLPIHFHPPLFVRSREMMKVYEKWESRESASIGNANVNTFLHIGSSNSNILYKAKVSLVL